MKVSELCLVLVLTVGLSSSLALAAELGPQSDVGSIRGQVADQNGRPLALASVVIPATGYGVTTGSDGSFEMSEVPVGTHGLEARLAGYAVQSVESVWVVAGESTEVDFHLAALEVPLDEVIVTSSYSLLQDKRLTTVVLDREEIADLPHFGDDLYRAVMALPAVSGGDISARFAVRGGFHDELLVRLDGVELFEPFHLKDFEGVFNILDPEVIGGVELVSGSFPAQYGDRMTGLLDMTSNRPSVRRTSIGISFSNAWAGSSGTFADDKGSWLGSIRRGYLDLVMKMSQNENDDPDDEDPKPRYWDAFGKIGYDLGPGSSLAVELLVSDDILTFAENQPDERVDFETGYGNAYSWVSHQGIVGSRSVVETSLAVGRVDRDRVGDVWDFDKTFSLRDVRTLDMITLRNDWDLELSERHYLQWGLEARSYDAEYDYSNGLELTQPINDPRFPPGTSTTFFSDDFGGEHYSLHIGDRFRIGKRFTAEIGARYDEQTLNDESQVSPRLNLVYSSGSRSFLRFGWGQFYQSQRPHELDVQFGETEFLPAQRAEHFTLGFEKQLGSGYALRVDAYRREVSDPHPRYEGLFDPWSPILEMRKDRIRIAADAVDAQGVEVYFRGKPGRKFNWWMSYVFSSVEDETAGRTMPRSIDQPHAVTLNAAYRPSRKWNLNWVWTYHTGWPTTEVSGELVRSASGEWQILYAIGPFYEDRLPAYHRLDLRASRTTELRRGELTFFIDVQNLYGRDNLRGIAIDDEIFIRQPDGRILVEFATEDWLGILPSFGVSWQF